MHRRSLMTFFSLVAFFFTFVLEGEPAPASGRIPCITGGTALQLNQNERGRSFVFPGEFRTTFGLGIFSQLAFAPPAAWGGATQGEGVGSAKGANDASSLTLAEIDRSISRNKNNRAVGYFLVIPGSLLTLLGLVSFAAYISDPDDQYMGIVGAALFGIPGIALFWGGSGMIARSNRQIKKLQEMKKSLQAGAFVRPADGAVGIGLTFAF